MGLPVRRFGSTGWELTTIGPRHLGARRRGLGLRLGTAGDAESIATIHHAVEAGINWLAAINRTAAADVIQWCDANDTGVIVYSPIHSGLLSGT
jgi:aryl-alcohol dehydrogenase-like predicted oxidoreductase